MISILVVDDSAVDRIHVRRLLEKHFAGVVVSTANDGAIALEVLNNELPDLVITDMRMPNLNGLELVRSIRERHPSLPVLLMTATGNESLAVEALRTGAASYVPKNELANDLASVIRQILGDVEDERKRHSVLACLSQAVFQFENNQPLLTAFTTELRGVLQAEFDIEPNDCLRISTAIDEALANAYYHGNLEVSSDMRDTDLASYHNLAEKRRKTLPYSTRRIHLAISINDDLIVSVRDEGPGFDPNKLPDPLISGFAERAGGRGVLLMRSFMDEVCFNNIGNEVTLTKRQVRKSPANVG